MKISAVLTTVRFGGFDLLVHSFKQQTMPVEDYQVIVVDELYEQRKGILPSPPFVHIPPKVKTDIYDNPACYNVAISVAQGAIVCFLTDFCWCYPDYLKDHWEFYKAHPGWSMSGYFDRYDMPPIALLETPKCNYSVFEKEFNAEFAKEFFATREPIYRERKGGACILRDDEMIEMPGNKIYLLGDSMPLEVLREINGIDERLNGVYGNIDIDVGIRANLAGWKFGLNPESVIAKFGMPGGNPVPGVTKKKTGTAEDGYKFIMDKIDRIKKGDETLAVPDGFGAFR